MTRVGVLEGQSRFKARVGIIGAGYLNVLNNRHGEGSKAGKCRGF